MHKVPCMPYSGLIQLTWDGRLLYILRGHRLKPCKRYCIFFSEDRVCVRNSVYPNEMHFIILTRQSRDKRF